MYMKVTNQTRRLPCGPPHGLKEAPSDDVSCKPPGTGGNPHPT